jgi:transcription antitermination protein NusB
VARKRSRSRGWALQILYAWETRGGEDLAKLETEFLATRRVGAEAREYLQTLIAAVHAHLPEIDRTLEGALLNWRLERLSIMDRNILRLATAEMLFLAIPPRVVIQEALLLAEKYSTAESPRFINGVLDAVMRREGVANSSRGGDPA